MGVTSYYSTPCKSHRNLHAFKVGCLVLEAILNCQNSAKQVLSYGSNFLIPLLNFFGTKEIPLKNRPQAMRDTS